MDSIFEKVSSEVALKLISGSRDHMPLLVQISRPTAKEVTTLRDQGTRHVLDL